MFKILTQFNYIVKDEQLKVAAEGKRKSFLGSPIYVSFLPNFIKEEMSRAQQEIRLKTELQNNLQLVPGVFPGVFLVFFPGVFVSRSATDSSGSWMWSAEPLVSTSLINACNSAPISCEKKSL